MYIYIYVCVFLNICVYGNRHPQADEMTRCETYSDLLPGAPNSLDRHADSQWPPDLRNTAM